MKNNKFARKDDWVVFVGQKLSQEKNPNSPLSSIKNGTNGIVQHQVAGNLETMLTICFFNEDNSLMEPMNVPFKWIQQSGKEEFYTLSSGEKICLNLQSFRRISLILTNNNLTSDILHYIYENYSGDQRTKVRRRCVNHINFSLEHKMQIELEQ